MAIIPVERVLSASLMAIVQAVANPIVRRAPQHRALTSVTYKLSDPLTTKYQAGATPTLLTGERIDGSLRTNTTWTSNESPLP